MYKQWTKPALLSHAMPENDAIEQAFEMTDSLEGLFKDLIWHDKTTLLISLGSSA